MGAKLGMWGRRRESASVKMMTRGTQRDIFFIEIDYRPNKWAKNETTACQARANIFPFVPVAAVWVTSTGFSSAGIGFEATGAEAIALGFDGTICFFTVGTVGEVEVPTARSAATEELASGVI